LQTACGNNDIEAVAILLKNGADPNKTPPFQLSWHAPIQIAASNGNVDMMAMLIENGADVELHGRGALIKLTKDARRHINERIPLESYKAGYSLLEQHGMSASHPSFDRPLLCESALLSDIEVTKFLIEEKEIPANICDSDGRTALHFACLSGYADPTKEYIQYLIDHGVDPARKDSFGKTAYDYAVEDGHTEIADLLICTPNLK
jgi:ankyrin repeat protein